MAAEAVKRELGPKKKKGRRAVGEKWEGGLCRNRRRDLESSPTKDNFLLDPCSSTPYRVRDADKAYRISLISQVSTSDGA